MFCSECKEELIPLRGSICISGTNTYCAPCWGCPSCGYTLYIDNKAEFDLWVKEYNKNLYLDLI